MANILKKTLNSKGNWINSPNTIGTVVLDTDITPSEIKDYLPDNSSAKYDREFGVITSGSTLSLLMNSKWYLCQFNAEVGTYDSTVDRMSGLWKVVAESIYIV